MLLHFLKTAWRNLVRNRVSSVINLFGLTLGVTACLIIFILARLEFGYDRFHPDGNRIYRIVASLQFKKEKTNYMGHVLAPLPGALLRDVSGIEEVTTFYTLFPDVSVPGGGRFAPPVQGQEPARVIVADPAYFSIFRYQWLAGDARSALSSPFTVVLSESAARKYFGAGDPEEYLGRQLIYEDSLRVTVSGIVKDWTEHSDLGFTDFISAPTIRRSFLNDDLQPDGWNMWNYVTQGYVMLSPGVRPEQVEKQFPAFAGAHIPGPAGFHVTLGLEPLSRLHFDERYPDAYSRQVDAQALYGLIAIAVFILLLAAMNFINLSTAQAMYRAKEIGVRKVLGSGRAGLMGQFMVETFLLLGLAVGLALLLTNPVVHLFRGLLPKGVPLDVFTPTTWIFVAALLLVTGLLAGWYPARVVATYQPVESMKGKGPQLRPGRAYLRKSLVVFQFAISLVFIIGTIIVGRQVNYALNGDLGFDKDAILTIHLNPSDPVARKTVLVQRLREVPGILRVSLHSQTPTAPRHSGTIISSRGSGSKTETQASFDLCDTGYLPLFGLKLAAGRNLLPSDTIREFLLNETCARELGFRDPKDALGKLVTVGIDGSTGPVVGVVKDYHTLSLRDPIGPFFMSTRLSSERSLSLKMATEGGTVGKLKEVLNAVTAACKEVYPGEKLNYTFFDETIAALYEKEEKTSLLMKVAMGIAIAISCMGLFGLSTFTARRRTKEIGIRKVLGAGVARLVLLLSGEFLGLVFLSLLIAGPLAWYFMHRWLEQFAYRVGIPWWVFLTAGAGAIAVAWATVAFWAVKAARANPVDSLRSE